MTFQLKFMINVIFFVRSNRTSSCLITREMYGFRSAAKLSDQFVLGGGGTASSWSEAQLTRIM